MAADGEDTEMGPEIDRALFAWINLFESGKGVNSYEGLSNGKVLAAVFSELHPDFEIDSSALSSSDSWLLKKQNITKVVSEILTLCQERFNVPQSELPQVDAEAVAKGEGEGDLRVVLRLLLTSMSCSTIVEHIGGEVMAMASGPDTRDLPKQIAKVMQCTQEQFSFGAEYDEEQMDDDDYFAGADPIEQPPSQEPVYGRSEAEMEAKMEQVQRELQKAHQEVEKEREQYKHLEDKLSEKDAELTKAWDKALQGKQDFSEEKDQELRNQRERFEKDLQTMREAVLSKDTENSSLRRELAQKETVESRLQGMQDENDMLNERLPTLERDNERFRAQRDKAQEDLQKEKSQTSSLALEKAEALERAEGAEKKLSREKERLDEASKFRSDFMLSEAKCEDLQRRVNQLEADLQPAIVAAQKARAKDVKDWIQMQGRIVAKLESEKADLAEQLEEAKEQAESATSGGGGGMSLAAQLQTAGGDKDAEERKQLRARVGDLEEQLRAEQERYATLEAELSAAKQGARDEQQSSAVVVSLRSELAAATARTSELEEERDAVEDQLAKARTELREAAAQRHATEEELKSQAAQSDDVATAKVQEREATIARSKEDAQRLKDQLAASANAAEEAAAAQDEIIKAAKLELQNTEHQLETCRGDFDAVTKKLLQAEAAVLSSDASFAASAADAEERKTRIQILEGEANHLRALVEQSHRDREAAPPPPAALPDSDSGRLRRERDDLRERLEVLEKKATDHRSLKKNFQDLTGKYETARTQSLREIRLVSGAFYDMGMSCMYQQLGMLADNSQPQSWLAKRKYEALEFSKLPGH